MAGSKNKPEPDHDDRRAAQRVEVTWSVDCETADTFLYASIRNISALGIFVGTNDPLAVGTELTLHFSPPDHAPFVLRGIVQWVNPFRQGKENLNPGMGVRFLDLASSERERLVEVVKTIAYLRDQKPELN